MANSTTKKIRLGICMAGAVSAGAYTAGVVDYLIETLERWQIKKDEVRAKIDNGETLNEQDKLIPLHDVCIEVLSGASAGGMTAAVMAYSFNDNTYLNRRNDSIIQDNYDLPLETDTHSKLYTSWVNMADDDNQTTIQKLLQTDDIVSIENMKAILNSKAIDEIAEKAVPENIHFNPPAYVSEFLSVLLSVTNLEGIPIDIRFPNIGENNPTRNVLKMHSGFLHYQFNQQEIKIDFPPEILSTANKLHLAIAAKATGAFPFGLANRQIVVNQNFFSEFKKKLKENYNLNVNTGLSAQENYVFTAIDGGTINNEPIGTTVKILESKKKDFHLQDDHYVVLIDPFPTVTNANQTAAYKVPEEYTLYQQVFKIFGAIRNQSMFKQEDLLNGLEMDHNRYLIYPAKHGFYFLACGLLNGFSGFFKKAFRAHDYQLGRKNCQAFLRFYFGETAEDLQKKTDTIICPEQKKKWSYNINYNKTENSEVWKMPLIPDMLLLNERTEIKTPVYDGITTDELRKIVDDIEARIAVILKASYPFMKQKMKAVHRTIPVAMTLFQRYINKKIIRFLQSKISKYLKETFYPQSIKQDVLLSKFADIIEEHGFLFQKRIGVYAVVAKGGEQIISNTSDGIEAKNIASKGDYILTNDTEAKEKYIMDATKFHHRYDHVEEDYYKPNENARVSALQITSDSIYRYNLLQGFDAMKTILFDSIYIEAPGKESQVLKLNDYLVTSESKDEIYRIAYKEFNESYTRIESKT